MKRANKKIICIIQARTSSKRLPSKILADINGKKCIDRIIERVKKSKLINELWLATTKMRSDDILEDIAKKKQLNLFRGSTNNVLSRYYKIAKRTNADIIIRVTGDCPLIDYKVINKAIKLFEDNTFDYVSNTVKRTYPDGLDVEVFSWKTLEKTYKMAKHPFFLEHVTPYMHGKVKNKLLHGNFKIGQFLNSTNYSELRLTLDEKSDLKLLNIIFKNIDDFSSWKTVVNFMKKNTKLININKHIQLNEGSVISYNKYKKND